MNKYIYILTALIMLLTSCADSKEIDTIKHQIDVTIDPSTVLTPFHGFRIGGETSGLEMYSDKDGVAKLRITSFVYDETGELVEKYETIVDDYTSNMKFSFLAKEDGKYTIVSISNSIYGDPTSIESYMISNENNLSKLSIQQQHYGGTNCNGESLYSNWSVLGLSAQTIDVNQRDYVINLNLKPATSMIEIRYSSIHAWDEYAVDTYVLQYKSNTMVSFDSTIPLYTTGLSNGTVNYSDLDVTENSGNIISTIINILPCQSMEYNGLLLLGGERLDFIEVNKNGAGKIDITSGKEYNFYVDCKNMAVIASELGTKSKSTISDITNKNIKSSTLNNVILNNSYYDKLIFSPKNHKQYSARIIDLLNSIK